MTARPFAELGEVGQARRLRPLVLAALERYELRVARLGLISNGWNGVFRADTDHGPYAVRVSRPQPSALARSVRSEVEYMRGLAASTELSVPSVVPNREGELVTLADAPGVPEPRECVVFGWLGGPNLAARRSPAKWTRLGELMATMHRFADGWTAPAHFDVPRYDSCIPYGEPLVVFDPGRTELYGLEGLLREAVERTDARITSLWHEIRPIVLHGDLHQWNVKVHRGVLSPFDFEDMLWGAPILDVATSLYYVRFDDDYLELARAFKAGYERRRPWVEREPGEVERLMFARAIDLLNAVVIDRSLELAGTMEAFVRRREGLALVALGRQPPIAL